MGLFIIRVHEYHCHCSGCLRTLRFLCEGACTAIDKRDSTAQLRRVLKLGLCAWWVSPHEPDAPGSRTVGTCVASCRAQYLFSPHKLVPSQFESRLDCKCWLTNRAGRCPKECRPHRHRANIAVELQAAGVTDGSVTLVVIACIDPSCCIAALVQAKVKQSLYA